jgi:periplasmic protein TonB
MAIKGLSMAALDVQRWGVLFIVGAAHVALALTFSHMGSNERVLGTPTLIEAQFLPPEKTFHEPPPTPVQVQFARMDIQAPAPIFEVALTNPVVPSDTAPLAIAASSSPPSSTSAVVVEEVQYIAPPRPRYPPLSRRLKEQGTVLLKVLVDEHGEAKKIEIADSSGHERLDQAAVEAVAGATFRPFLQNGTARAMLVLIPIEFGLHRARG